jgi:hypothetical protein
MSHKPTDRPEAPREEPEVQRDPSAAVPAADAGSTSNGAGLKYVFKIAPADPKNSFDFEDVADK